MLYIALLLVSLLSADYVLASTDYADEPTGYNQLLRHRFNDRTNGGTCFDYFPDSSGLYSFIRSEANGSWNSSPSHLREQKPAGSSVGGTQIDCFFPAQRNIFWGFTFRTSNPFGGYNNGANKYGFMITDRQVGGGALWGVHYYGASAGSRRIGIFLQATSVNNCHLSDYIGDCGGSSVVFLPNVNGSGITEGDIHKVQITMKRSSTETSRDGTIRVVVDGVVRTNHTNVNFPAYNFISVQTNHTWDGQCATRNPAVGPTTAPNDCRPYDDYYDTDDWYVSAGAGGTTPNPDTPAGPPAVPTGLNAQKVTQ